MSLTQTELDLIVSAMDKSDYSSMGYPRYREFEPIKKKVLSDKEKNSNKTLIAIRIVRILESDPPQRIYAYDYA